MSFVDRVDDWIGEGRYIHEGLTREGPLLIRGIMRTRKISLRDLAKVAGVSPTYLSQVTHGEAVLSPDRYCRLVELSKSLGPAE